MRLYKKLIQMGFNRGGMRLISSKEKIPLQLYVDTFSVQLSGAGNTPENVQYEMSPIPFITSVEGGVSYDKNGDMSAVTTIYTDYSDADKAIFVDTPLWKPTTEYIRAETETGTYNASGMEAITIERLTGDVYIYLHTRNINGTSREKLFHETITGLPTPYHDKWNVELDGKDRAGNSNYTYVDKFSVSDVYTVLYEPHAGSLSVTQTYS